MNVKRYFGIGLVIIVFGFGFMTLVPQTHAVESATTLISTGLESAGKGTYSQSLTASVFIGNLIKVLLAATGIIFLVTTVYSGILYMTAFGEPDKIKKAKTILTTSLIGLIIIVGAYAISSYVISSITTAATRPTG